MKIRTGCLFGCVVIFLAASAFAADDIRMATTTSTEASGFSIIPAAISAFASAASKVESTPITSPVDFISGPRLGSTLLSFWKPNTVMMPGITIGSYQAVCNVARVYAAKPDDMPADERGRAGLQDQR